MSIVLAPPDPLRRRPPVPVSTTMLAAEIVSVVPVGTSSRPSGALITKPRPPKSSSESGSTTTSRVSAQGSAMASGHISVAVVARAEPERRSAAATSARMATARVRM
jgi:hypothetical protein